MASNALSVHLRLDIIVRSLGLCKAARKVELSLPLLVLPLRWLAIRKAWYTEARRMRLRFSHGFCGYAWAVQGIWFLPV